jgi:uncharacterized protein (DUF1810 family)
MNQDPTAGDRFQLQRFVDAQRDIYDQILLELTAGEKRTHWMWFVFPQIRGLGRSLTAQRFAMSTLEEARAYLDHPVLGPRLRECAQLVNQVEGRSIVEIFGHPDDRKFHSSMTLFARATTKNREFVDALARYFGGLEDPGTLQRLGE